MKELTFTETTRVSGAGGLMDGDMVGAFWGSMLGAIDGFGTGAAVGGKYGGAGDWIVGGISQLFGWTVSAIGCSIVGYMYGGIKGYESAQILMQGFRDL